MVGSSKSNQVRRSKNCRVAKALKKKFQIIIQARAFKNVEIYSNNSNSTFLKHLRDMTEAIKSANGVDNWSGEGK